MRSDTEAIEDVPATAVEDLDRHGVETDGDGTAKNSRHGRWRRWDAGRVPRTRNGPEPIVTRHLLALLPALLLTGCHSSGIGCSVQRALMAERHLGDASVRDPVAQDLELVDRLESELFGVRYFEPDVRMSFFLRNTGLSELEVKNGSIAYSNGADSTRAAFVPGSLTPDCETESGVACTFVDDDGAEAMRLPPGGQLIPGAVLAIDSVPPGADLLQTVRLLARREGEARWHEYRNEASVVVVEKRINCLHGLGHGYRRIDS